jgi:hypothetical protein
MKPFTPSAAASEHQARRFPLTGRGATSPASEVSQGQPLECSSCEQPYDPAGWCEACQQFAHEELPEKTLAQWIAENPQVFLEAQVRQLGDGTVRLEL